MSKYTTEVRFICETNAGLDESVGFNSIENVIENARPKIFNFDYPIFDSNYKGVLETKILKHYYTNEICEETVGLWKLRLNARLNEIMPYYNKLYESELLEFNPLYTHELYRDIDKENVRDEDLSEEKSGTNVNSISGTDYTAYSDTPQGSLTNVINDTYLTNAEKVSTNKTNTETISEARTNNNAITDTEDYLEHVYGFNGGSASKLLLEYRQTFLNIDLMIIKDLDDLFMQLW